MDVILLDNVGRLGVLGDRIDVKPGYGRNFLIPQGKAVPATQENIEKFEARRAELEATVAAAQEAAQKRAQAIEALEQVPAVTRFFQLYRDYCVIVTFYNVSLILLFL